MATQASHLSGAALLLASAITKLHPGAGRSPGLVDLPVVRDPLGYPYLPGSELKGAMKTLVAKRRKSISSGRVDCKSDSLVCCLLGGEVGEGPEGASAIVVTDMYPVLLPVPSPVTGVAYATTPYLLSRAAAYLRVAGLGSEAEALERLASTVDGERASVSFNVSNGYVYVGAERIPAERLSGGGGAPDDLEKLDSLASGLNPLYQAVKPSRALIVAPEAYASLIVSKALQRLTRVRLNRATKTVEHGALWTEEYLPWGTLLAGLIIDSGFRNTFCRKAGDPGDPVAKLLELLDGGVGAQLYLTIGGKESVGGGVVKAVVRRAAGGGSGG